MAGKPLLQPTHLSLDRQRTALAPNAASHATLQHLVSALSPYFCRSRSRRPHAAHHGLFPISVFLGSLKI
ncbi:hypothetical protein JMJ77_0000536 [Colletotrichum scovillei]|uniref:Uncharacterized protein n=1 Tax=Colletotrichum scovillei TaxID=1209932 RepID=A0A9P7R9S0_9PEZI|nr:hypothetical protein JMJ77_0000536 [Colletotrichum scovillei]KAG7071743.1 hypothetical protein JMJ76_0004611 [Colletotrichum scovillei]KAG7079986.1 hypothetical protein JMJ78_0007089 [Colletotrichum scovillei]